MKTLVVYDNEGYVLYQQKGIYRIPVGVPYIELELKDHEYIAYIDIETKKPVIEAFEKSDIDKIKEEIADINYSLMMGGLI